MPEKTILFLHGFASSGRATKAQYLEGKFDALPQIAFHAIDFNPTPRDFEYMTATGLINRLRQYALDRDLRRFCLIGSSFGGLVALHYAQRYGQVERMLLLAPVLRWLFDPSQQELAQWEEIGTMPIFHYAFEKELPLRYSFQPDGRNYQEPIPPACPATIIHGHRDAIVPAADSRAYAAAYPDSIRMIEVDADHDLNHHLSLIWEQVQSFLLDEEKGGP